MSSSTAAQAGNTPTTLRPSAHPLSGTPEPGLVGDIDVPPHVEPFAPFDWTGGDAQSSSPEGALLRELLNNTINIVTGAVLCLRIADHCAMVGDLSPQTVELEDGTLLEQPDAPYLGVSDCAALQSMVSATLSLLVNDAHQKVGCLRR